MSSHHSKFWNNKVAVVTGGTAGLGLEIVRQLVERGARVGIIARNPERLDQITRLFAKTGQQVVGFSADVCEAKAANHAIRAISEQLGDVDVLINNVGMSSRFHILDSAAEDYLAAFRTNVLSAVNCTLAAASQLRRRHGSVVNIASLAAKTAWPFVAPYSTSKAALAAFTHQLRLELDKSIHVLLVCPGPIRRDDAGARYDNQAIGLPPAASQPGAGVRLKGIPPAVLAAKILRCVEKRKAELVVPAWARLAFAIGQLSPRLGDWLLRRFGAGSSTAEIPVVQALPATDEITIHSDLESEQTVQ